MRGGGMALEIFWEVSGYRPLILAVVFVRRRPKPIPVILGSQIGGASTCPIEGPDAPEAST